MIIEIVYLNPLENAARRTSHSTRATVAATSASAFVSSLYAPTAAEVRADDKEQTNTVQRRSTNKLTSQQYIGDKGSVA